MVLELIETMPPLAMVKVFIEPVLPLELFEPGTELDQVEPPGIVFVLETLPVTTKVLLLLPVFGGSVTVPDPPGVTTTTVPVLTKVLPV